MYFEELLPFFKLKFSDSKSMWDNVKTHAKVGKMKGNSQKIVLDTEHGELDKDGDVANYLNQFFKTKVMRLQKNLSPCSMT